MQNKKAEFVWVVYDDTKKTMQEIQAPQTLEGYVLNRLIANGYEETAARAALETQKAICKKADIPLMWGRNVDRFNPVVKNFAFEICADYLDQKGK